MVLIIISWLWIGIASFLLGFAAMQAIGKVTGEEETRCKLDSVEIYILMGLVCLTVYSQVFSFSGRGRLCRDYHRRGAMSGCRHSVLAENKAIFNKVIYTGPGDKVLCYIVFDGFALVCVVGLYYCQPHLAL